MRNIWKDVEPCYNGIQIESKITLSLITKRKNMFFIILNIK